MKFCGFNGITSAESLKMLPKGFRESTLSRTKKFERYKAISEGRKVIENSPHASSPSFSVTEIISNKFKKQCLKIVILASER